MPVTRPYVRTDLDVVDLDGESVVYDPRTREVHYLNHSAALVFALCDGTTTMKEMADAIADVYEAPLDEVEKQVRSTVRRLRRGGLLESSGAQTTVEPAQADHRELVRMQVPKST